MAVPEKKSSKVFFFSAQREKTNQLSCRERGAACQKVSLVMSKDKQSSSFTTKSFGCGTFFLSPFFPFIAVISANWEVIKAKWILPRKLWVVQQECAWLLIQSEFPSTISFIISLTFSKTKKPLWECGPYSASQRPEQASYASQLVPTIFYPLQFPLSSSFRCCCNSRQTFIFFAPRTSKMPEERREN